MSSETITVMQVFEALGVKPHKKQAWSVGGRVAGIYRSECGHEPPKANRPKRSGSGSNCLAIYPPEWFPRIAEVVRTVADIDKRKQDLFGFEGVEVE